MERKPNRLAFESSPYLLQHAHNPVDWYPWGEEALKAAIEKDLPILVSIGYSACHWCHVMERESFENEEIAILMNENFINIKIDREERPDLDYIYMDAVQAMTGSGGWPLNVFLTPEAKPFFGGTYFPPKPVYNRVSWKDLLISISSSFREKRQDLEAQAENLTAHILQSNSFGQRKIGINEDLPEAFFIPESLDLIFGNIMKSADKVMGGFGKAPKFPQTFLIRYLLHHYYYTHDEQALNQACLSLDKMIAGGIYDQLGGGFARYSTDTEWMAPHFEKMLYDNALLLSVLCDAYQITKKELYKNTIEQTIWFVETELKDPVGGFYSALDADSEGEEGKYYVWEKTEIERILGDDASLFCEYYQVSDKGNWEGKNILHFHEGLDVFAKQKNRTFSALSASLKACKEKLLKERSTRPRPQLDNKIILSWNGLMNSALSKAYAALGNERYKQLAVENMQFLLKGFRDGQSEKLFHCHNGQVARIPAFLDDYAFLIASLIQLQEITAEPSYLLEAKKLTEFVLENFSDSAGDSFFYTQKTQKDVIVRKKEVFDGATASGNSIMALNLLYLSVIFDIPEWKERTINICFALGRIITSYPSSFGVWATLVQAITYGVPEIAIIGKAFSEDFVNAQKAFWKIFIPFKVYQSATQEIENFPLLSNKPVYEMAKIYLCINYSCQQPYTEIVELERQLLANVNKLNRKEAIISGK